MTDKDLKREANIIAAVACAVCGSPVGQRCREGLNPHDHRRGVEDLRPFLDRVHADRRRAWIAWKQRGIRDFRHVRTIGLACDSGRSSEKCELATLLERAAVLSADLNLFAGGVAFHNHLHSIIGLFQRAGDVPVAAGEE